MEDRIIGILKSIGFTNNEILVYLDLLKNSTSSPLEISKRTKLHRSNVYDILRNLEEKKVINKIITEEKNLFKANNPDSIIYYIKEKEKEIVKIIPDLENIEKNIVSKDLVSISYGLPGLRDSFKSMMEFHEPIYIFNVPINIQEYLGEDFLEDFHKWRIKNSVTLKIIYSKECSRMMKIKNYPLTEVRCLSEEKESLSAFVLCKDRLYLILTNKPLTIVEIRGFAISDTFKNNFDFFWNHSKKLV